MKVHVISAFIMMPFLWSPFGIGQTIIFLPCGFFFLSLFLLFCFCHLISAVGDGCLPYFHTWCGLSVNLECRSEMCCTRLAENAGRKKSPSAHHRTTLLGYIFATKARIDNRKKNLLSSNISSRCPPQYGALWPTSGWDRSGSFGHPS